MLDRKRIVTHIGVLTESSKGWKKELNRISWNGAALEYDIREWAPGRKKMGKGITLFNLFIEWSKSVTNTAITVIYDIAPKSPAVSFLQLFF